MIRIVAKSIFKDGKLDDAIELYSKMLEPTREEKGCISYDLCIDTKNDNTLAMIEEWADQDCFNAHLESAHYKATVPALLDITVNKEVSVYKKLK